MRALFLLATCALGCNAVWGIEAADGVLAPTTAPDTGGEDPCAPASGIAKVCVTFEAAPHPPYDVSSGAEALRLDGSGIVSLFVYDEDPGPGGVPYAQHLKLPGDAETKIDAFPATFPVPLTPGRHWLIAQFEDNKAIVRGGDNSYPPGDFMTVPGRAPSTGRLIFQFVDAVADQTVRVTMPLQPLRKINVDLQADVSLRTTYKDFAVNGDGPIVYVLFDGAFSDTTPFLEFVSVKCVNAAPMTLAPPLLKSAFTTVVTGTHSIVASLEDYDSVSRFPTRGSLMTPAEAAIPSITISPTAWTANTSLKFVKVLNPFTPGEKSDDQRCP